MSDIQKAFEGFDRVTVKIDYYIPTQAACDAIAESPPRLLRGAHTGILQQFSHQYDDRRETYLQEFERLRFSSNSFNKAVHEMTPQSRLRLYFARPSQEFAAQETSEPHIAGIGILHPGAAKEDRVEMPGKLITPEDTLKALVPYGKVRSLLNFWEKSIAGPLHSMQYASIPLLSQQDIKAYREYRVN